MYICSPSQYLGCRSRASDICIYCLNDVAMVVGGQFRSPRGVVHTIRLVASRANSENRMHFTFLAFSRHSPEHGAGEGRFWFTSKPKRDGVRIGRMKDEESACRLSWTGLHKSDASTWLE